MRVWWPLGIAALALAGCLEPDASADGAIETMVIELRNTGSTALPVTLTVTSPSGEVLLDERISVGSNRPTREVGMTASGTYTALVHYDHQTGSGGSSQDVAGSRAHHLRNTDCDTTRAIVIFQFEHTSTSSRQIHSSPTSWGECLEG